MRVELPVGCLDSPLPAGRTPRLDPISVQTENVRNGVFEPHALPFIAIATNPIVSAVLFQSSMASSSVSSNAVAGAPTPRLTTSSGSPVDDNSNSMCTDTVRLWNAATEFLTLILCVLSSSEFPRSGRRPSCFLFFFAVHAAVGKYGPLLLQDFHLIDKLAHFDRERIPERVVHAKGAGAHGYFEVTHDVSAFCKAKFLSKIGKRTPIFARFSTVGGEKGSADAARDPRGFAVKHYTEDGVWDMVGNNTPIFFVRDPIQFIDFIHSTAIQLEHDLILSSSIPPLSPSPLTFSLFTYIHPLFSFLMKSSKAQPADQLP
jgi:hypothetical protein